MIPPQLSAPICRSARRTCDFWFSDWRPIRVGQGAGSAVPWVTRVIDVQPPAAERAAVYHWCSCFPPEPVEKSGREERRKENRAREMIIIWSPSLFPSCSLCWKDESWSSGRSRLKGEERKDSSTRGRFVGKRSRMLLFCVLALVSHLSLPALWNMG